MRAIYLLVLAAALTACGPTGKAEDFIGIVKDVRLLVGNDTQAGNDAGSSALGGAIVGGLLGNATAGAVVGAASGVDSSRVRTNTVTACRATITVAGVDVVFTASASSYGVEECALLHVGDKQHVRKDTLNDGRVWYHAFGAEGVTF